MNQSRKQTVRSATSSQRKHDDVPSLDLKLSQSNEALGKLRQAAKDVKEDLNIEYMGTKNILKDDAYKLPTKNNRNKKQEFIEQAILQDQVERMKLTEEKSAASSLASPLGGVHQPFDSRLKRVDQLFNTKSMVTGTHEDLSNRFRFSARLLSLNGRDALRELNGFFFIVDNTLTVYEFRQFGSRANARPFIERGSYAHMGGSRKNRPYTLLDIRSGTDLVFETSRQPNLSDGLKSKHTITLRVTETDSEETRHKLLYHGCTTGQQKQLVKRSIDEYTREENNEFKTALRQVQAKIRQSLQSRGTKMMTSLFHHFKTMDKTGNGLLSKDEIKASFQKFRIQISDYDFDMIWKLVDANSDGDLDYGEFVRGFFGEMSEARKRWVRKAFTRLDPTTTGVGEADNFYKFFCAAKHPSVVKEEMNEASLIGGIEEIFQITKRRREIPYQIFEAYYEGISLGVSSDDQFVGLLRSTWSLS